MYNKPLLKIGAIYEKDKITLKESDQFRIGRVGRIENLNIGTPLYFKYTENSKMLVTSFVTDYQEDDYGVSIETENTYYRFDKVKENRMDDTKIIF